MEDTEIVFGFHLCSKAHVEILEKKVEHTKKSNEFVEQLEAHCGFYLLKRRFSLPNSLYFSEQVPVSVSKRFCKVYDKMVQERLRF